jgi:hypothetical protein
VLIEGCYFWKGYEYKLFVKRRDTARIIYWRHQQYSGHFGIAESISVSDFDGIEIAPGVFEVCLCGELVFSCYSLISELQSLLKKSETTVSLVALRVHTRLLHLRGRLRHLPAAGLCTSSSEAKSLQKFHEQLDVIEQVMATVGQDNSTGESSRMQAGKSEVSSNTEEVRSHYFKPTLSFTSGVYQKLANHVNHLLKKMSCCRW